jgi:hypothetical protein
VPIVHEDESVSVMTAANHLTNWTPPPTLEQVVERIVIKVLPLSAWRKLSHDEVVEQINRLEGMGL